MGSYDEHASAPDVLDRLRRFEADVLRWTRAQNLVSRSRPEAQVDRLILESLLVARWLGEFGRRPGGRWADIGSGGGFPGIVLAAVYPEQEIDLIERRQGRCDFLRREIGALGLERARALEQDAASAESAAYSLVCLKAVAPPPAALALAAPLLSPGGRALLFQRPNWRSAGGWRAVGVWRGENGRVDLSNHAAHLLEPES